MFDRVGLELSIHIIFFPERGVEDVDIIKTVMHIIIWVKQHACTTCRDSNRIKRWRHGRAITMFDRVGLELSTHIILFQERGLKDVDIIKTVAHIIIWVKQHVCTRYDQIRFNTLKL